MYYPIALSTKGLRVLIVGAGEVAERKILTLLKTRIKIKVVAPVATLKIERWVKKSKIDLIKRKVRASDLRGVDIVIAATSSPQVNEKISRWAKQRKILVNVVDQPVFSSFISPAQFRAKKAIVAVYTNGRDPVLSRDLKNFLKRNWDAFLSYRKHL